MIRVLLAVAVFSLAAAPALAGKPRRSIWEEVDRCPGGGSNMVLAECAAVALDREDVRLNRVYKAAMARLKPPEQAALRTAQRKWIRTRDSECREYLDEAQYGRQGGILATVCQADLTRDRADEIERAARRAR